MFKPEVAFSTLKSVAFSADGRDLAIAGRDNRTVHIYDTASQTLRQHVSDRGTPSALRPSMKFPTHLSYACNCLLYQGQLRGASGACSAAWSPAGQVLAVAGRGAIRLYDGTDYNSITDVSRM